METAEHEARLQTIASLTSRQIEVLELVADRRTNKEIAAILGISPSAVEQRLQSVRQKFGVQSRADLARAYTQLQDAYGLSIGMKNQVDPHHNGGHHNHANGGETPYLDEVIASGRNAVSNLGRRRDDISTKSVLGYDRLTVLAIRVTALTVTTAALALLGFIALSINRVAH